MVIEFVESSGAYLGTGEHGRRWRITQVRSGWRLKFTDVGDLTETNAGLHQTLQAAQTEAGRHPSRRSHPFS
jgi:hypothetical protein